MRYWIIVSILTLSCKLNAQITDNFNDSNLSINPTWLGTPNAFGTLNAELKSTHLTLNSSFYISTPSSFIANCTWQIDTRLLFNTSSTNYVDILLCADSANLQNTKNAYFVRLGGTADEISLYKTKAGIDTKIIDGTDGILNTSNNAWQIKVTKLTNNNFTLQRTNLTGGLSFIEGNTIDSDIVSSSYFGIRIRQSTAGFVGKHYFDNLNISKNFKDTIAPKIDSLIVESGNTLKILFNEPCDSNTLLNLNNYQILQGNIKPINSIKINAKSVNLLFANAFDKNKTLHLSVKNIADTLLNKMQDTLLPFYYSKPDTAAVAELLITELMPDPEPTVGLPNTEYVEIKNISNKYINLNGCKIHDPSGFKPLPNIILPPDSIIALYNIPSLNNSGDNIWITNQLNQTIDAVNYTLEWYKNNSKKNGGWSLELIDLNYPCKSIINWAESIDPKGGTPGKTNSINGTIADNNAPEITSFYGINDSILQLNFNEPLDSVILLNATFKVNNFAANFKLKNINSNQSFWLLNFKPNADSTYSIQINNLNDCSGNSMPLNLNIQWASMALKNNVIVNEILFNPSTGEQDFIELYNNSSKAIDLSQLFIATIDNMGQYKSIDKISASKLILLPKNYLLLTEDTITLCQKYTCGNTNALKIKYTKMPSLPDDKGNIVLINQNGQIIDSMGYSDKWHNPLLEDNNGVSLERLSFNTPSNLQSNWYSAASTVGYATPAYTNSQQTNANTNTSIFTLQSKTLSPDEDGFEDQLIINYNLSKPNFLATINIYNTQGTRIKQLYNNETLSTQGFITWNGTDYNNQKANMGIYIITIECINANGTIIKEKLSCVVAGKF